MKAAQRSLGLLEMLQEKTLGNLDEAEREELWSALRHVRGELAAAQQRLAELEQEDAAGFALPSAGADIS